MKGHMGLCVKQPITFDVARHECLDQSECSICVLIGKWRNKTVVQNTKTRRKNATKTPLVTFWVGKVKPEHFRHSFH